MEPADVEFIDGDAALGTEEELASKGMLSEHLVRIVIGLAVVAFVIVAILQPNKKSPSSAPIATDPSTSFAAGPVEFPTPTTSDVTACPSMSLCSVFATAPDNVLIAVRERFPGAVATSVLSVQIVPRIDPIVSVWYRRLAAKAGQTEVVITVQQPRPGDHDASTATLGSTGTVVIVDRALPDRTVRVSVRTTDDHLDRRVLRAASDLAADVRLVSV